MYFKKKNSSWCIKFADFFFYTGLAKLWGWQDNVPLSMILTALALSLTVNALCVFYVRKLKMKTCNNCKGKKSHSYQGV